MIIGVHGLRLMAPFTNIARRADSKGQRLMLKGKRMQKELTQKRNFSRNLNSMRGALHVIVNGKIFPIRRGLQNTR